MKGTLSMVERLDLDAVTTILRLLNDPADIVRFAAVSRTCQKIVVESRFVKDLCIGISPEVALFNSVVVEDKMSINEGQSSCKDLEWENLKREHRVYAMLAHELRAIGTDRSCICEPVHASSTDNYPEESIINTLDPRHREAGRPSYWSSKGESNIQVPETLTYALHTELCVVHEIKIRPFRAYFQLGAPIYSANAVRFRLGYFNSGPRSNIPAVDRLVSSDGSDCEDYVWMYVSQEYPMQQVDKLQTFKLPRPVLCIGAILQIELLGRIQKQVTDGLYYICVCHVDVVGRPLSFLNFEVLAQARQFILKYSESRECSHMLSENTSRLIEDEVTGMSSVTHSVAARIRQARARRVIALLGNTGIVNFFLPNNQDSDEEDGHFDPAIF
ncbi:hypothetical protein KI387_034361 [Taxus chinensis]|uniref:F-box protein n=1 Tax=Taxus chinensis TaxID=29808 RepID=A0AA38F2S8_TAXCH|nr:hypothetical protein KI387_034361 [Taxus chinensis]